MLDASPIGQFNTEMSGSGLKVIRIRTGCAHEADVVRESFVKFIDENSECLCPILITNEMNLELECNGK